MEITVREFQRWLKLAPEVSKYDSRDIHPNHPAYLGPLTKEQVLSFLRVANQTARATRYEHSLASRPETERYCFKHVSGLGDKKFFIERVL